jgi:hypothetical protein
MIMQNNIECECRVRKRFEVIGIKRGALFLIVRKQQSFNSNFFYVMRIFFLLGSLALSLAAGWLNKI